MYKMLTTTKIADKYEHNNYAHEHCKSKVAFLQFVYLSAKYWQLFTPKRRILRLILNSRRVFKNQLYFMVTKYNFAAFFKIHFPYAV